MDSKADLLDSAERFAALAETFTGEPSVARPDSSGRRFGSAALKVEGSIFAMLTAGRLVVKLPRDRVDDLIGSGVGGPFDSGKGRPMKEWVAVRSDDPEVWQGLAREALTFVRSLRT